MNGLPHGFGGIRLDRQLRNPLWEGGIQRGWLGVLAAFALVSQPVVAQTLQEEFALLGDTHPRIKAERNNVAAAEEGVKRAFGDYFPTIDLLADYGYDHVSSPGLRAAREGSALSTPRESFSLTLTENLFNGFRREADYGTARLNKGIAEIALDATEQDVFFEAATAYLNVLRNVRLVDLASRNEQIIQRQLNLEDERVRRGAGIAVDVLLAKSRLQIAKERRVAFEGNRTSAMAQYVQVFDRQPEIGSMSMPSPPLGLIPASLEEAEASALAENPVVANSNRAIDVARERKRLAESPYYPEIDAVAEYNFEQDVSGVIGTRRDYSFKIQLRWELFSGFKTRSDTADASFRQFAAMDNRLFVNRKTIEDVRLSWNQLETARKRVALLQNAINIASEVHDARVKLRDRGKETVINVLDAENEVFNAQISATDADFDMRIAIYRVILALGRLRPEALIQPAFLK